MMDSTAAIAGFDPMQLPIDRFCNWVVQWFRERLRPLDFQSFEARINRPAPGVDPLEGDLTGPWSEDAMSTAFMSVDARGGGKAAEDLKSLASKETDG